MLIRQSAVTAASLVLFAGSCVVAQPVIDGVKGPTDGYGNPRWVQTVPTSTGGSFGDNIAGLGSGASSLGDPSAVTSGIEIAIPYAAIGYNPASSTTIRIAAFISSADGGSISNQWITGLPVNTPNFDTNSTAPANIQTSTLAGNQFIQVANPTNITNQAAIPTVDGRRDGQTGGGTGSGYGTFAVTGTAQTCPTFFGDAGHGQVIADLTGQASNGSELNGMYLRRNDTTQTLHVLFTGNLEANGNRLNVFFDTVAGGQNRILSTTTVVDPLGAAVTPGPVVNWDDEGTGNGLTFDAGFEPDFMVSVNGNEVDDGDPLTRAFRIFVDHLTLPTAGGGVWSFCGSTEGFPETANTLFNGGALTGANTTVAALTGIRVGINNSNTGGVVGLPVGISNQSPNPDFAYGSEINAVYSKIEGNFLYVLVTGNLKTDFSKLNLFFDGAAGGQNRMRGDSVFARGYVGNVDIDFNGLNRLGANQITPEDPNNPGLIPEPVNGLKFDADFAADYWITMTGGGNPISNFANSAFLRTSGKSIDANNRSNDYGSFDGGRKRPDNFPMDFDGPGLDLPGLNSNIFCNYPPRLTSADPLNPVSRGILIAMDQSNVAGVTGTTADPAAAAAVTTGMEMAIRLDELFPGGWDGTTPIKMAGFVSNEKLANPALPPGPGNAGNGDRYAWVSNQVLGGLPLNAGLAAELGDPRDIDFSAVAGNQYIVLTGSTGCGPADVGSQGGDIGADGQLNNNDFAAFITLFFANDARADVGSQGGIPGSDGQFNNNDFAAFITLFFAGCP